MMKDSNSLASLITADSGSKSDAIDSDLKLVVSHENGRNINRKSEIPDHLSETRCKEMMCDGPKSWGSELSRQPGFLANQTLQKADVNSCMHDDVIASSDIIPSCQFTHRCVTLQGPQTSNCYEIQEFIGGGRFGRVYRCIEKKSGMQLAAKCFICKKPISKSWNWRNFHKRKVTTNKKRTQQDPIDRDDVMMEIAIMNQIDHANIVKLYDAFETVEGHVTMILEYLAGGELFERVIADQSQLTELDAVLFMKQITDAVQYLHKNRILHLDLKPENILCLDRLTHHLKIIDFGLSKRQKPRTKLLVQWGTPEFMAPEILNYEPVTSATDMWSVGVITYIILSGLSPFLGESDEDTSSNIADMAWDFDPAYFDRVSADAKHFISCLLLEEKSGRMSATQCLRHDWLAKPLTSTRREELSRSGDGGGGGMSKLIARMRWKTGVAVVSGASWLRNKIRLPEVTGRDEAHASDAASS